MRFATGSLFAGIAVSVALSGCINPEVATFLTAPPLQPIEGRATVLAADPDPLALPARLIGSAILAERAGNLSGAIGALQSARKALSEQSGQGAQIATVVADLDRQIARLQQLAQSPPQAVTAEALLAKAKALAEAAPPAP